MSRFYTNVNVIGSTVYVREVVDGIPNMRKDTWQPTLFVKGKPNHLKDNTNYTALTGETVYPINPGTIVECKEFVERYKDVSGFPIFGQLNWSLQYMNEYKPTQFDYSRISAWGIDIETKIPVNDEGKTYFPVPKDADGEMLLITMIDMHNGRKFTFGTKPYNGKDTHYTACADEKQLLTMFLQFWEQKRVDIITGWNIRSFDIPYLYVRICRILGEEAAKRLSPWGRVTYRHKVYKGKDDYDTRISGVSILDYIELYQKYILSPRESYSLSFISQEELGKDKLNYDEFDNFTDFYTNGWDKFVSYNVIDAELVKELDDKLKLIELVLTLAYSSRINFEDVSSPVKLWDAIISNHCFEENVILPQQQKERAGHLDGAYVKEPKPGWYKDVVSLDATSLYPSIIMTNNISPETYLGNCGATIDDFLNGTFVNENQNHIVTPAGAVYDRTRRGILPILVEKYMKLRKLAKTEMLRLEQEYENTKDESLQKLIAAKDNEQMAYKVAMNSLYGATANEYFRFFKLDHAASITLSGQYVLRTIENNIDDALKEMFKVGSKFLIYIDTDSLYFTLSEVFDKFNVPQDKRIVSTEKLAKEKISMIVNKYCEACCKTMNSFDNKLSFKLEAACDKSIFVGKKKYALRVHSSEGVTYAKPKFKVKGFEMVRSSTPKFVREQLKKSLDLIFDNDEKTVQHFVENVRTEFMQLPYQDVCFPRGANNLDEYADSRSIFMKGTPIQVRGVLLYNHYLKEMGLDGKYPLIGEGEKIKFAYLNMPNRFKQNVVAYPVDGVIPKEFQLIEKIDYQTQYEKTFLSSMEIVLNAIGWYAIEHSSLEDFFG